MTWAPTRAIVTARAIPDNILAYIVDADRQADVLTWAGNGDLKLIKTFASSVGNRLRPVYPSIAFLNDEDAKDYAEDIISAVYRGTFEIVIQNSDPDQVVTNARVYAMAIESMILNCPNATVTVGTGASIAVVETIQMVFDEIKTNEKQNDFFQPFNIRVSWLIHAGAYS